jgi:hypothetical protein
MSKIPLKTTYKSYGSASLNAGSMESTQPREVLANGAFRHYFRICGIKGRKDARSLKDQGDSEHAAARATSGCSNF